MISDLKYMPLDDDMPTAPAGGAPAAVANTASFSGEIEGDSLEKVPEMGEPLPRGIYHMRLERYTDGWAAAPKEGDDPFGLGTQPYLMLFWHCQQEPEVGRSVVDFCPWVNDATARAANDPSNPLKQRAAQTIVNDRCWKAKAIAEAAGWKGGPGVRFNVKNFLATNPEVRLDLGVQPKKVKSEITGKYENDPNGGQQNRINRYLPLFDHRAAQGQS